MKAKVTYTDLKDMSVLASIDDSKIPSTNIIWKVSQSKNKFKTNIKTGLETNLSHKTFKKGDIIYYEIPYHEHIITQYTKTKGDEGLKFIDLDIINKQRNVLKHLIMEIGSNILKGNDIMNVSLPINIFDQRSLLEVFAHQCRLAPIFLEMAGEDKNPLEKIKYSVAYAISRIHLSVTQLKPFNPIWGETFQCQIENTQLYLEQSCHHPPIYHFYHVGKSFKSYGYQRPEASTGANSVYGKTLGKFEVEFKDGNKHVIYPCDLSMKGTLIGDRTFAIVGKFYVVDVKNDYIAFIEFNPDKREGIGKWFSKKTTLPDHFEGCITKLSQVTYNPKDETYALTPNYTPLVKINGNWSTHLEFDNKKYWEYSKYIPRKLLRMKNTLPSDSTLRGDCFYWKKHDTDKATSAKAEMEEIQRRDRKLRADYWQKSKK